MRDVLIIGGGVVGCAVARELSAYGLDTVLLEKNSDICEGQSKANTAIIHGGYDAEPGTLKAKFNVLGSGMFERICAELDVPYERNGALVVSFSPEDDGKIDALLERGRANGVGGLEILGHDDIMARERNINPAASRALYVPTGGIVCPYELTVAYAENAARNGVEFRRNAAVTGISRGDGAWRVSAAGEVFQARAIVNCAGVYSDVINNTVSENRLHITPRRGEYWLLDKKQGGAFRSTVFQVPTEMGKGILVARTVDGTVLIGPTADDIIDRDDARTTVEGLEKVMTGARLTWPALPARAAITAFSGIRAHGDGGDFVIGEASDAPLFFNAACVESPGLSSAPAIGLHLAKEIAERLGAAKKQDFDPVRRAIPRFREMTDARRAEAIAEDRNYGVVVCRCESVTEAEIRESIRRPVGARTLDGVKRRTRAGMGRCQGGFCSVRVMELLCEELHLKPWEVTKCAGASAFVAGSLFDGAYEDKRGE